MFQNIYLMDASIKDNIFFNDISNTQIEESLIKPI